MTDHDRQHLARTQEASLPSATYRLQFHAGFTFRDASAIVPYLHDLGISHVYASPFLKARPGSTHGYDIVDHAQINPEIGTPEDFDAFVAALHERGMGLLIDIVPNHMGVATNENPWWTNVLENGPASKYAEHFDIAWKATSRPELQDKVLLPVLGEPYGEALESGKLKLGYDAGSFTISYYDRRLPVAPRTYATILGRNLGELERRLGAASEDFAEYQSILTAIRNLPDRTETDPARVSERHREKEIIKRRLGELAARNEGVQAFIAENVAHFNGRPGDPRSFDPLDELLSSQAFRLSFWRVALEEINYRRFFDINDLAAVSVERREVFDAVHGTVLKWVEEGKVDGLRIDHPDGLYDPKEYLDRLRERGARYVVVEKILGKGERLPADWDCDGTTGYEFLAAVNGLFVNGAAEAAFDTLHAELAGNEQAFAELVYRSKRRTLLGSLAGELNALAYQLDRLAQRRRHSRDFTFNGLRGALIETIACFPVYRSYITERGVSADDRKRVILAVRRAEQRNPLLNRALFRFLRDMVLLQFPEDASDAEKAEQVRFAGKFQQVTSPVMAKGLEDTAFYIFQRLVSLNEVGGHPDQFGTPPAVLHAMFVERRETSPYALSPLSTHDTKRSEDVRARINVLSEMAQAWGNSVLRWRKANAAAKVDVDGEAAPDANEEYLIYQTLVGSWPAGETHPGPEYAGRIAQYMVKALHEAKIHSSWVNPQPAYDDAVAAFVQRILESPAFLDDFVPFQAVVAEFGRVNTLAQTLVKITAPGVPDTYQGTELPDFSLVDPDNRRPVDYERRAKMLGELKGFAGVPPSGGLASAEENEDRLKVGLQQERHKLFLTWKALQLRREHPRLFSEGEYMPLNVESPHAFAFLRRWGGTTALVVVPRLPAAMARDDSWKNVRLFPVGPEDAGEWRDALGDRTRTWSDAGMTLGELFEDFPVALLVKAA
jgi:(1->4)-alpha-D-glucan 1-alpha-D-glucosylmutase